MSQLEDDGELGATVTPAAKRQDAGDEVLPVSSTGRYIIEKEVGAGGQSRVYAARDTILNRIVALKASRDRGSGAQGFLREARITGQLEHPGIVPVHDLGRSEDGEVFVTQKFVRGRTLREVMDEATTLPERLKLLPHFISLCQAAAYAHARSVAHRDLKPENVMVGEFGETLLLDWGVARVLGQPEDFRDVPAEDLGTADVTSTSRRLEGVISGSTQRGTIVGTPLYMSPEQATGDTEHVDGKSDVWALGVMLYELLAFNRPFTSTDARVLLGEVARGHYTPLLEAAPDAPPELISLVEKTLTKHRDARPDAKWLATQLSDYLSGKRVEGHEYSSWQLLTRFVRQNRALTAVTLAALVALGGSEVLAWHLVGERDDALKEARLNNLKQLGTQAREKMELALWNDAHARWQQSADAGGRWGAIGAGAVAPWLMAVDTLPGEALPPTITRGAFDVTSGRALLSSEVAGVFNLSDGGWHLEEGTVTTQRTPQPVAVAPGGEAVAYARGGVHLVTGAGSRKLSEETPVLLRFSSDGEKLAAVTTTEVSVYRVADGHRVLQPATPGVDALALGGLTVVFSSPAGLRWWHGDAEHSFPGEGATLTALATSHDGRQIFAADGDRHVQVFDAATEKLVRTLDTPRGAPVLLAGSPDGLWLASCGRDGLVHLWETRSWRLVARHIMRTDGTPVAMTFSADSARLGLLDNTGTRVALTVAPLKQQLPLAKLADVPVHELAVAPGGMLYARSSSSLSALDAGGALRWRHDVAARALLALDDGVLVGAQGTLTKLSAADGAEVKRVEPCQSAVWALVRRAGADTAWAACGTKVLSIDVKTLVTRESGITATTAIRRLALSPDGAFLAYSSESGAGALVALENGRVEEKWNEPLAALAFSADGKLLVTSGEKGVTVRSGTNGMQLRRPVSGNLQARSVGFAFNDSALWAAGVEKLTLWDPASEASRSIVEVPDLADELTAAVRTPQGEIIAADLTGRLYRFVLPP